ncbi:hypothetical protein D0Z07_0367 [Hyphodiscus hymeniophilus]|uniref:NAD(P)-binding domain-containing protein n=1 Tax=Hyphodiscus hymeniophilus TaxID=353542 RepID=A0A9P6VR94_9HELO|nr:hypothetical protein D0Z07_0367 [Hyphodiscus hymeniophilus]
MKLVIGGATGFVGKELLKRALACPEITSIVTLDRRALVVEDLNKEKLTSIVLDDFEHYPTSVMEKIGNADACIWTVAVALTKSMSTPFPETKKVTYDYTVAGIKALSESNKTENPLRFIYFSGAAVDRDLTKEPVFMPEYSKLRAGVEIDLIEFAANSRGAVKVTCVRPGYIKGNRGSGYVEPQLPPGVPTVILEVCVAAVLKQCVEGIEMDPILNDDLERIGKEAMPKYYAAQ